MKPQLCVQLPLENLSKCWRIELIALSLPNDAGSQTPDPSAAAESHLSHWGSIQQRCGPPMSAPRAERAWLGESSSNHGKHGWVYGLMHPKAFASRFFEMRLCSYVHHSFSMLQKRSFSVRWTLFQTVAFQPSAEGLLFEWFFEFELAPLHVAVFCLYSCSSNQRERMLTSVP
eukprot:TRINITY_DN15067_c0_g1_i1.p1 TRINITY_DN15067_c0_g1~~TRINITY_DN15067_c0_g1_i1.p1  ORF type:complete len:173 (+),score=11.42 TRINITY_DN15067_c0_g1_i1:457-975(+)